MKVYERERERERERPGASSVGRVRVRLVVDDVGIFSEVRILNVVRVGTC